MEGPALTAGRATVVEPRVVRRRHVEVAVVGQDAVDLLDEVIDVDHVLDGRQGDNGIEAAISEGKRLLLVIKVERDGVQPHLLQYLEGRGADIVADQFGRVVLLDPLSGAAHSRRHIENPFVLPVLEERREDAVPFVEARVVFDYLDTTQPFFFKCNGISLSLASPRIAYVVESRGPGPALRAKGHRPLALRNLSPISSTVPPSMIANRGRAVRLSRAGPRDAGRETQRRARCYSMAARAWARAQCLQAGPQGRTVHLSFRRTT